MGKVSCGALKWFLLLISFMRSTSHWFFLLFFYFESLCLKIVCTMVLWVFFRRNSISVTCLWWSETNRLLYLLLFFWYFFEIITCLSLCFVIVWHLTLCNYLLTKICSQFKPNFTGAYCYWKRIITCLQTTILISIQSRKMKGFLRFWTGNEVLWQFSR